MTGELRDHFDRRSVLVTGHTGFKGSWMTEWLLSLGAKVTGVALEPEGDAPLFEQLGLAERVEHHLLDVRNRSGLSEVVTAVRPDTIFHLAAQPLVLRSYEQPIETFETNVMGTVHVLEAVRDALQRCELVVVTTDKVYADSGQNVPYPEGDPIGGHDPYSSSKAAVELVVDSYRRSYFLPERYGEDHEIALASARAGNVIGGGDWATDRIVPDAVRALMSGGAVRVRNPSAIRPWQHVLESLGGYLTLAARMAHAATREERQHLFGAFNFGPDPSSVRTVEELVERVLEEWPGEWVSEDVAEAKHEADYLALSVAKAERDLGWVPVWGFDRAVGATIAWYRAYATDPTAAIDEMRRQINEYSEQLESATSSVSRLSAGR